MHLLIKSHIPIANLVFYSLKHRQVCAPNTLSKVNSSPSSLGLPLRLMNFTPNIMFKTAIPHVHLFVRLELMEILQKKGYELQIRLASACFLPQ